MKHRGFKRFFALTLAMLMVLASAPIDYTAFANGDDVILEVAATDIDKIYVNGESVGNFISDGELHEYPLDPIEYHIGEYEENVFALKVHLRGGKKKALEQIKGARVILDGYDSTNGDWFYHITNSPDGNDWMERSYDATPKNEWNQVKTVQVEDDVYWIWADDEEFVGQIYFRSRNGMIKYNVTFDADGGSPEPGDQLIPEDGMATMPEPDPDKTGYTFMGWYLEEELYDFSEPVKFNLDLVAHWEAEDRFVTYDFNDGETDDVIETVKYSENAPIPENPERVGFKFDGWLYDSDLYMAGDTGPVVYENITLVAQWEAPFEVTFDYNDEDVTPDYIVDVFDGDNVTIPENPTRDGFVFVAWSYGGSLYVFGDEGPVVTENITLIALWLPNVDIVIGDVITEDIYLYIGPGADEGADVAQLDYELEVPEGYELETYSVTWMVVDDDEDVELFTVLDSTFVRGLFEGSAVVKVMIDFDSELIADVSDTANVHVTYVPPELFTVTFDYNDEGATDDYLVDVYDGENATIPENPTRAGFEFDGWLYDGVLYMFGEEGPVVTGNITIVAQWLPNVEIVIGDVAVEDIYLYIGPGADEGADVVELNYELTMPEGVEGTYSVSWEVVDDDEDIELFTELESTFVRGLLEGSAVIKVMIDFDSELIGDPSDTANVHVTYVPPELFTVTFDYNDEGATDDYLVDVYDGENVTILENPTRLGFEFDGWLYDGVLYMFGEEGPVVTENITIVAQWLPNVEIIIGDVAVEDIYLYIGPGAVLGTDVVGLDYDLDMPEGLELEPYTVTWMVVDDDPDIELFTESETTFVRGLTEGTAMIKVMIDFENELIADVDDTANVHVTFIDAEQFTVTFDYNDGVTEDTFAYVDDGDTVTLPENPTRDGFVFNGWLYDGSLYGFEDVGPVVTENITLVAQWLPNVEILIGEVAVEDIYLHIGPGAAAGADVVELDYDLDMPEGLEEATYSVSWMIVDDDPDIELFTESETTFVRGLTAGSAVIKVMIDFEDELIGDVDDTANVHVTYHASSGGNGGSGGSGGTSSSGGSSSSGTSIVRVTIEPDAITLDYGQGADPEFTSFDFKGTVFGTSDKRVTWSVSDDTFVTVDRNGVVTTIADIPVGTGDITVDVTVTSVADKRKSATAVVLFEEKNPLGAIEFYGPYVSGYPDGTFGPARFVSRAEIATMFARILNLNLELTGSQQFVDVDESQWYYAYVQAMARTNIFVGYENGEFRPDQAMNRAEIAAVFAKFWEYKDIHVNGNVNTPVSDVPQTHWASTYINKIYNADVVSGFPDGTFRPEEPTLREQIVVMVNTLIARPENKAPKSKFKDILNSHWSYGHIEAASQPFVKQQDLPE